MEREEAKKRQTAGVNQHTEPSGNLPEGSVGRSRDRAAEAVGMSGRTYEKAKAVVKAAEAEPEKYRPLVEQMNVTGKVDGAFKEMKAMQAEEIASEEPDDCDEDEDEEEWLDTDGIPIYFSEEKRQQLSVLRKAWEEAEEDVVAVFINDYDIQSICEKYYTDDLWHLLFRRLNQ